MEDAGLPARESPLSLKTPCTSVVISSGDVSKRGRVNHGVHGGRGTKTRMALPYRGVIMKDAGPSVDSPPTSLKNSVYPVVDSCIVVVRCNGRGRRDNHGVTRRKKERGRGKVWKGAFMKDAGLPARQPATPLREPVYSVVDSW